MKNTIFFVLFAILLILFFSGCKKQSVEKIETYNISLEEVLDYQQCVSDSDCHLVWTGCDCFAVNINVNEIIDERKCITNSCFHGGPYIAMCINEKCTKVVNKTDIKQGNECTKNDDCGTGGCSNEVCTTKQKAKDLMTNCVYKPEYECLSETICGCYKGNCIWIPTKSYENCLLEHNKEG